MSPRSLAVLQPTGGIAAPCANVRLGFGWTPMEEAEVNLHEWRL